MKIVFQSEHFEEHKISDESLIRLMPYGVTLVQDPSRPTFLLKSQDGVHVLPVSISPIEAGATIQQGQSDGTAPSPHRVLELLLETLAIRIVKCVFVEIRGHHQYVRLFLEGHPSHGSLKVRADEAMSLCLKLNVPIFASKKLMNRSRTMSAELEGLAQGLQLDPGVLTKTHEYLI